MGTSTQIVGMSLFSYIPEAVAWLCGIILAVVMFRRGGGRTEKLFLAGCSLLLITRLATPLLGKLVVSLTSEQGISNIARAQMIGWWVSLPMSILRVAGLVCLVWAFWVRFRKRRVSA